MEELEYSFFKNYIQNKTISHENAVNQIFHIGSISQIEEIWSIPTDKYSVMSKLVKLGNLYSSQVLMLYKYGYKFSPSDFQSIVDIYPISFIKFCLKHYIKDLIGNKIILQHNDYSILHKGCVEELRACRNEYRCCSPLFAINVECGCTSISIHQCMNRDYTKWMYGKYTQGKLIYINS